MSMVDLIARSHRLETTVARADAVFDKRTLRERCTIYIRDLIITGKIQPGDHLVETRLSDELGVSRGTLREAMRPLQNEGLLVADGRGHLSVRQISAAEIREVFQVRAALEILAASMLATREDRHEIGRELRNAILRLKDPQLDFGAQIQSDLGFHELLCKLSGNDTLLQHWRQLIGQIEMMIIAVGADRGASRMRYEDHVGIVEAIESGDLSTVRVELTRHFDEFAARYLLDYGAALAPTSVAD
ncbi:GntR family transcriptional regulator [Microbacterium sp. NPDC058062]|uniref:GntR family transcriptional regulator n=1 Tax=Microbacterium sp. NPDC058062 TaxID=3346320 RepID=UPI0036DD822E